MLENDDDVSVVICSSIHVSDECYAIVDSNTNAVIAPQHKELCGEVAESRVPCAKVHGSIV